MDRITPFKTRPAKPEYVVTVRKAMKAGPQSLMQIVKAASRIAHMSKTATMCAMDTLALADELVVETINNKKIYRLKK